MIDNRNSSGVPDELVVKSGLPIGAGKGLFESPTFTCNHCSRVVVMNPLRTRERGYCRGCDHYICDDCTAVRAQTMVCKTMLQAIDEAMTAQLDELPMINRILLPK